MKSSDQCPRSRSCYLNRPSGPHWPVWPVSSGPRAICLTPLTANTSNSLTAQDFYGAPCFPVSEREAACTWLSLHSSVLSRLRQSNRPTHPLINISQHCESAAAPPHILNFRFKDMKKLRCNTCSTKTRVYYSLDRLISTFTLSTVLRYFYYWCFTWKFKYICLNISILCLKKREIYFKKIFLRSFILTAGFLSSVCVSLSTSAHWRSARLQNEGGRAPKMHQEDQREEVQKKGSHCR